ncbi:MAG: tRNA (adenosine(37)-N6)-threonylcarbamoyltransferase complex ATPase subunit type 1 TsaE [Deltaproteobacteria bacterium]|nr:tRNA (adenosine(37)-N6)-threonylcarbamoyltransferase complex ATPase subunit type 1 TsaE [Deltaproteobacteria bacterium]
MESWTVISRSAKQTRKLGFKLGKLLQGGEIIGLVGELGSGKTCFVRGSTEGLEVSQRAWIRSPTFTLVNEYHGRLPIYHIDLYRLESAAELEELNLRDYLYSSGVSLIEWFEYFPAAEVDDHLEIRLAYGSGSERELKFTPHGEHYEQLVMSLKRQNQKR